jgi:hypothetical protein
MGLILTNNAGGNGRVRLTNSLGTNGRVRIWLSQPSSNDPDAQAFITAAGITDPTQQSAINTLVLDLKSNNIWTKMDAIYPMVGGTATTHKFNLKNPADTNAAFRLSFFGGVTHTSNGVDFNGTNSYADSFLTPSTILTANNNHLSYYSRNVAASTTATAIDMGAVPNQALDPSLIALGIRRATSNASFFVANSATSAFVAATTVVDGSGFFNGSIINSSSRKLYRNGSTIASNILTGVQSLASQKIFIGAISNNNVASLFSNRQCAFATIGSGLSDAEALALYTSVQAMQTTLGRQV